MHELLTASLGFCGRHSRELLTFGGQRPAAAVVERSSLLAAIRRLPELVADAGSPPPSQFRLWGVRHQPQARKGEQPPLPDSIKPCPACVRQIDEESRGIKILLAHLEEFTSPLLTAGGLCLPHFLQAVSIANHTEREALLNIQQSVWATLAENLDEVHPQADAPPSRRTDQRTGALAVERTIDGLTGHIPFASWSAVTGTSPAQLGSSGITAGSLVLFRRSSGSRTAPVPTDDTMNHVAILHSGSIRPSPRQAPARP